MLARLEYLRDRLNTSFWLVPGSMTLVALAAAPGILWLETTPLGAEIGRWTAPSAVGAEGARLVLSTIAGSMITVASAVSVAMLLAILSFGWLIFFIHDLAKSIQVDTVVARTAGELGAALERMPDPGPETDAETRAHHDIRAGMPRWPVEAGGSGYIQAIDARGLVALAEEHAVIIEMSRRSGQFVIPTSELAAVAGLPEIDERLADRIRDKVILGQKRTSTQDVEFSITLLVEVAARALSPGVNDLLYGDRLRRSPDRRHGTRARKGPALESSARRPWTARVELYSLTFGDLADAAFNPIRQDGRDNVAVSIRLLESLTMLAAGARKPVERDVLRRHGSLVAADALEQIGNEKDRRDVETRAAALQAELDGEAAGAN